MMSACALGLVDLGCIEFDTSVRAPEIGKSAQSLQALGSIASSKGRVGIPNLALGALRSLTLSVSALR